MEQAIIIPKKIKTQKSFDFRREEICKKSKIQKGDALPSVASKTAKGGGSPLNQNDPRCSLYLCKAMLACDNFIICTVRACLGKRAEQLEKQTLTKYEKKTKT